MRRRRIGVLLALAWLPGCAATGGPGDGGGGQVRGTGFPSEEALEGLREAPGPEAVFEPGLRDVETWTLRGPFPERVTVEPWSDESPAGRVLARLAETRPGLVVQTRAMHCVARELGLFFLEHGARPPEGLNRAARGTCRSAASQVNLGWVEGEAPAEASDEQLLEAWSETVEETIRGQLVGGPRTAGVWLGRDGGRALLMVAVGERRLHLEPVPEPEADGTLVLEGEALVPASEIHAAVTRGRLGFAYCRADELPLPRFRFRCPVDPGDPRVWLTVSLHPPGRLIGQVGVELLLWPDGAVDPVYRRPSYAVSRQAWDEETAAAGFAALLNEIREDEGLEPLRVDEPQSAVARDLAPHFFEALFEGSVGVADLVMLGLLAGWSVDGIVQSAHFASSWVPDTNDVGRLLSEALEYPMARSALLADDAERIAIGPVLEAGENGTSMAVVVGTYALFSEESHGARVEQVFAQLARERAARGRAAPDRLEDLADLSTDLAGAVQAGAAPQEALHELLNRSGEALGRAVRGWVLESSELEDIAFPAELLDERRVSISIGVASYRPEGEAWGRHVVLIVAADPGRGI